MKRTIAIVAGTVLTLGLSAGPSQADEPELPTAPTQVSVWETKPNPRTIIVHVKGYQPEGTTHKKNGAPYKVVKRVFHWGSYSERVVVRGHVTGGDVDRIRVRFPNTKIGGQVSTSSRGSNVGLADVLIDANNWQFN